MDPKLRILLLIISIVGWLFGLYYHYLSFINIEFIDSLFPLLILHLGILIVWGTINVHLLSFGITGYSSFALVNSIIFKNRPIWTKVIVFIHAFYMLANIIIFIIFAIALPEHHANHHLNVIASRSFSAAWIGFYGIGATILFPIKKRVK